MSRTPRIVLTLSLLSLPLLTIACQKEVTEVRRDYGPVAPGSSYANRNSRNVAPTGKPQQPTVSDMSVKTNSGS